MHPLNDPGLGRVTLRGGVSSERGNTGLRVLLGLDLDTPGYLIEEKVRQLQESGRELHIETKFKPDRVVMEIRRAG